ncbi:MAG: thioredoxin domain-containing protein [Sphingobacteriia bacterium]
MPQANALIHETSPYLLQHAHHPVHWQPWGEAALAQAQREQKLVLISIGYSACHWCHVMEHQSFEDEQIAALMNAHFVCIKVDREERPDIDQLYMDAVQLMSGQGGWPLNCFALPDGRPVYGGTYFPPRQWTAVLQQLAQQWRQQPARFEEYASRLTGAIRQLEVPEEADETPFRPETLHQLYERWHTSWDPDYGGENRTPKFAMPVNLQYLLAYGHTLQQPQALAHVHRTLTRMAWGGLYDAVGGGFARYSTDRYWHVPHFEKMLYDNAQLVSLYSQAWRQQPDPLYRQVVQETLDWIADALTDPSGAFYSALDADSEGEEGQYYVWTLAELQALLGPDAPLLAAAYTCTEAGNWEHGKNVLHRVQPLAELAPALNMDEAELSSRLASARLQLWQARAQRPAPGLDDKTLAGWNALMIRGYVEAYRSFGKAEYLEAAQKNAHFIEREMAAGDSLHRSWKQGQARINAYLDDYALLIEAYIHLHAVTLDAYWLRRAAAYVAHLEQHYWDAEASLYRFTSRADPPLIAIRRDLYDNVIPSANSTLARVLPQLGTLLGRPEWAERARKMLQRVQPRLVEHGSALAGWAHAYLATLLPAQEVVACGPQAMAYQQALQQQYLPFATHTGAVAEPEDAEALPLLKYRWNAGETNIYVCSGGACQLPVSTVSQAIQQLRAGQNVKPE